VTIRRLVIAAAAAAMTLEMLIGVGAVPALAHEARTVGPYHLLVGFGEEPPYAGVKNSVQVVVARGGNPVTDIGSSLKVQVIYGTATKDLSLEPTFDPDTGLGTPGDYRAWFVPTAAGPYTFRLFGSIGSTKLDESFKSGPTTFNDVVDPGTVEFPLKLPTLQEVATKVDRSTSRVTSQLTVATEAARHGDSSVRLLALAALVIGLVGVATGAAGLLAARRGRGKGTASG
jgi:hypothetical protein